MATKAERINGKPEVKKKSSNNKNKRKKPIKIAGMWTCVFLLQSEVKWFEIIFYCDANFYLIEIVTQVTCLFRECYWDQKAEEIGHPGTTDTGSR